MGKTPASKNKKQEKPKKSKRPPAKFFAFEMKPGAAKAREYFDDATEAKEFKRENQDLIEKARSFASDKAYAAYKKKQAALDATPTKMTVTTPTKTSTLTNVKPSSVEKMIAEVKKDLPTDSLKLYFHTTTHSPLAHFILTWTTAYNDPSWLFKPKVIAPTFRSFAKFGGIQIPTLNEAMKNATTVYMRDPKSSDPSKIYKQSYKSTKKESSYSDGFDVYLLATYITIPHEKFQNGTEELSWLQDTANTIGESLRKIMLTDDYIEVLKQATRSELYFTKIMNGGDKYVDYPKFLHSMNVKVIQCEKLSSLIIQADATNLSNIHYANRLNKRKYALTDAETKRLREETEQMSEDEFDMVEESDDEKDDKTDDDGNAKEADQTNDKDADTDKEDNIPVSQLK